MESIGRYRIEREVGRGGAGVVFRARSPEGRDVAVKLLLAGPLQRRVTAEVQALLRLRHPGVVQLLDAGEHHDHPFLVMEWVEGETLGARLVRDGPLDPGDAVELVARLAEALEHCHAQGVLHRDLKPDNVMLRALDDAPLLTDFGLSKDLDATAPGTTRAGCWLGTPGFCPPEQALGRLEAVGPRSDVYGLGAVLYAALTASPPHDAATLEGQFAALERAPPPPSDLRPGVPAWLDAVCLRALAPEPAGRPESPARLAGELRAGAGLGPTAKRSLRGAVLLFALSGLAVGAAAAWALRPPPPAPPPAPAATPDPQERRDAALARADRLRLAGQLHEALAECERAIALDPRCAAAYSLRGQLRGGMGAGEQGLADHDRAIALDPRSGPALARRGLALLHLGRDDAALADLDRAVELAPLDAHVHLSRALARNDQGRPREAIADCDRALELDPRFARAWSVRGTARSALGDHQAALADFEQALQLDPGYALAWSNRGNAQASLGRPVEALADFDRALALDPRCVLALANRGYIRASRGQLPGALADFDRALELDPTDGFVWYCRGQVRDRLGRHAEAVADLDRALELDPGAGWASDARRLRDRAATAAGR